MPRAARHIPLFGGGLAALLLAGSALAQVPAEIRAERTETGARILIDYADSVGDSRPGAEAVIEHTVLIARLGEALEADVSDLAASLDGLAARARLDPDGSTLRVALNQLADAHVSTSYDQIAIDLVPPGNPAPAPVVSPREQRERDAARQAAEQAALPPPPPPPVDPVPVQYRVGQATEYTRIELLWPRAVDYALSQQGEVAEVRFAVPAEIDLSRLAGSPPRFLERLSAERDGDEWVLRLTVEPGVEVRAWDEGSRVAIDLPDPAAASAAALLAEIEAMQAAETGAGAAPEAVTEMADAEAPSGPVRLQPNSPQEGAPVAADPAPDAVSEPTVEASTGQAPADGVVHANVSEFNGDLRVEFDWAAAPGAAVFRRGEAVWIVFDAVADLDLRELDNTNRRHVRNFQAVQGENWSAARVIVPSTSQPEARLADNRWTIVFSERIDSPPRPINVRRDARRGQPGRILLDIDNALATRWVRDPVVGDRIGVITAGGPVQGLAARREFVGGTLLPSAQGGAVAAIADDIEISLIRGGAAIGRPSGLNLTPASGGGEAAGNSVLANVSSPALMYFDAWQGDGYFPDAWKARLRRAALEDGIDGLVGLARFLIANELAIEALGMLDIAIAEEPSLANDAHVRALQGVASYMMSRNEDAKTYLGHTSLAVDPAADLWRGMIAVGEERWEDARRRFQTGERTVYHYPPVWQARFHVGHARAALELGDLAAAQEYLYAVETAEPDRQTRLATQYVSARLAEAMGNGDAAIEQLQALVNAGDAPMEAQALYDLIRLQLDAGELDRASAIEELENLRFRWRGDNIELDTVRMLGELYVQTGEFARGLETMDTAQARFPDTEAGRRIADDMNGIFRRLFLEGEADRMDPIEAVAVFYQYQHLAPIGADGDRMIRRLADRLIAFDLLEPASELLQHQVDNRLREPLARARVATDLAIVYLMDRRYEDAINTLRGSRVAGLPEEVRSERYLLEARAYAELGRRDQALELIASDRSDAANRLRADVAWTQREWDMAGTRLEAILGNRYVDSAPLSPSEEADLMRAAIAYSLARNSAGSSRLGQRYGAAMERTDQAAAFELLTSEDAPSGNIRFSDMATRIASIDTLEAFMQPFRARFSEGGES
ncbi:tetratricopeptide repeat protein [Maricaulis sp. CAU 1757]